MFALVSELTHSVQALFTSSKLSPTTHSRKQCSSKKPLPNRPLLSIGPYYEGAIRVVRTKPSRVSAREMAARFNAEPTNVPPATSTSFQTRALRTPPQTCAGRVSAMRLSAEDSRARGEEVKAALTNILNSCKS